MHIDNRGFGCQAALYRPYTTVVEVEFSAFAFPDKPRGLPSLPHSPLSMLVLLLLLLLRLLYVGIFFSVQCVNTLASDIPCAPTCLSKPTSTTQPIGDGGADCYPDIKQRPSTAHPSVHHLSFNVLCAFPHTPHHAAGERVKYYYGCDARLPSSLAKACLRIVGRW